MYENLYVMSQINENKTYEENILLIPNVFPFSLYLSLMIILAIIQTIIYTLSRS